MKQLAMSICFVVLCGVVSGVFAESQFPWDTYYEQPAIITNDHFTSTYGPDYELVAVGDCEGKLWLGEGEPTGHAYIACQDGLEFVSFQVHEDLVLPAKRVLQHYGTPVQVAFSEKEHICSLQYMNDQAVISFDFDQMAQSQHDCQKLTTPENPYKVNRINVVRQEAVLYQQPEEPAL